MRMLQKELKSELDPASRGELKELLVDLSEIIGKLRIGPVSITLFGSP